MLTSRSIRSLLPGASVLGVFLVLALGVTALLSGCVHPAKPQPAKPTSISGRVVYSDNADRGIPDAMVRAVGKSAVATTDSTGWFTLTPDVADGEFVQLSLSKSGYNNVVTTLSVRAGVVNMLASPIALTRSGSVGGGPGGAANSIVLKAISATSIGVNHAGTNATCLLTFEVRDSQGIPVNFAHRATVQFTLSQQSGGGAFLNPDTLSTDEAGLVSVALNSGTLAQSVQVRAQVAGTNIYSDLVPVGIHGGLPDARHFSFAVNAFNIPGLVTFGVLDPITAFVGDRYGNPVAPGTVVYFTTSAGLIEGSAATDDHGRATADLESAAPLPNALPAFSDSAGQARVSIQTMDQNQSPIVRSALAVMFSGHTALQVTPTSFAIALNGAQDFSLNVWDQEHHNPLAAGSKITVTASAGTLGGEVNVTLPDTWDPAYTHFTFRLENPATGPALVIGNHPPVPLRPVGTGQGIVAASASRSAGGQTIDAAQPASITVTVTSPNGNAHTIISGTVDRP